MSDHLNQTHFLLCVTLLLSLLCYAILFLYFIFPPHHESDTQIHDNTLNQHKCHLILTPLAGSLPPASNSAFNISQPKAGHRQWSCHAVLSKQTLPPKTLSACKAPVIQPWNLPTFPESQHHITSPLPLFSLLLLHSRCFWASLYPHIFIHSSDFLLPPSSLFTSPALHSHDLLSRPQGLTQLLWWQRIVGYQLQF